MQPYMTYRVGMNCTSQCGQCDWLPEHRQVFKVNDIGDGLQPVNEETYIMDTATYRGQIVFPNKFSPTPGECWVVTATNIDPRELRSIYNSVLPLNYESIPYEFPAHTFYLRLFSLFFAIFILMWAIFRIFKGGR